MPKKSFTPPPSQEVPKTLTTKRGPNLFDPPHWEMNSMYICPKTYAPCHSIMGRNQQVLLTRYNLNTCLIHDIISHDMMQYDMTSCHLDMNVLVKIKKPPPCQWYFLHGP